MNIRRLCAGLAAIVLLALEPAFAKSIDFDAATIADINAAFDAGTLTAESLTQMCLARIAAFDRKGPSLHAVMTLNPNALAEAIDLLMRSPSLQKELQATEDES